MPRLWVCWSLPRRAPAPGDAALSFLPPREDEALAAAFPGALELGRERSAEVRRRARAAYLEITARLGASPDEDGVTLRRACAGSSGFSPWWFHPSSFKDCEHDPAFSLFLAAYAVEDAARRRGADALVLWGAPAGLAEVLASRFSVESEDGRSGTPEPVWWLRAAASRARLVWRTLRERSAALRLAPLPSGRFDAVFSGFWDWSVWPDGSGGLADRYYKALPAELAARGLGRAGWLCWLAADAEPGKGGRSWDEVLAPLRGRDDALILQTLLGAGEIVGAALDLRPLRAYLRRRGRPSFRALFRADGLDFRPLFEERLLRGFLDACLPRYELHARAVERAFRRLRPRLSVTFFDHFLYARSHYEGARRAGTGTLNATVQHASYCREKPFLACDPERELRGKPDGLPMPAPDHAFAMGGLGAELFRECGYADARVHETGSPRYDHVRAEPLPARSRAGGPRLLALASIEPEAELDMLEGAAAALEGAPGAELVLRCHPFLRVDAEPRFAALRGRVRVSAAPLDEDLAAADAVLFTSSTAADEAFLRGLPAWQWRPLGYDASALAEAVDVPRFARAADLRDAVRRLAAEPAAFRPSAELRARAAERLFHRCDGGAARRIAESLRGLLP